MNWRESTPALQDGQTDLRAFESRDLGSGIRDPDQLVGAVVEGSAIRSGGRVRITIQLIHAATDQHLWAETYDDQATDVLALQNRVARAVADRIRAELTREEVTRLGTSGRVHPDAYSLYLKGRFFARDLTESAQRKAIQYYQHAIDRDLLCDLVRAIPIAASLVPEGPERARDAGGGRRRP